MLNANDDLRGTTRCQVDGHWKVANFKEMMLARKHIPQQVGILRGDSLSLFKILGQWTLLSSSSVPLPGKPDDKSPGRVCYLRYNTDVLVG